MKKITAVILALTLTFSLLSEAFPTNTVKAAPSHTLGNPVITDGISIWDCVWFGNYYQEDSSGQKKSPIKWRVLSINGQDVFLMSDLILDFQPYLHSTDISEQNKSWADSDIRRWLNKTFINIAFTATEQKAIITTKVKTSNNPTYGSNGGRDTKDKIYLASFEEISNTAYGFSEDYSVKSEARKAKNTTYTAHKRYEAVKNCSPLKLKDFFGYDNWWLRNRTRDTEKMFINLNGKDGAEGRGCQGYLGHGVRPVFHLNLSKAGTLTYAGRINSKGETKEPSSIRTDHPLPPQPVNKKSKPKVVQLANVTIISLKNKKTKSVLVKWKKIAGVRGYQLQYSTSRKFKRGKTKNIKKITYLCKKLKKKKYYFRIRAYRISDKKKLYGCWSKTKKITVSK